MKQDYRKIRRAGAELVVISPDTVERHHQYGLELFGEKLPFLFVSDANMEFARAYGLLRAEEHPHGGFYNYSLWIVDQDSIITHKKLPWTATTKPEEYLELFRLIGSESGEWRPTCGLKDTDKAGLVPD